MVTVIDEIINPYDCILDKLFNAAKNKHQQQLQVSDKAINAKVCLHGCIGQALIDAKQLGRDSFTAIETVISWDAFVESVIETQEPTQSKNLDFLHRAGESYVMLCRYASEFLTVLKLRATSAAKGVFDIVEASRNVDSGNARKMSTDTPTGFIKPR